MTRKLITFLSAATLVAVFVVQQIAFALPAATFDPGNMSLALSGNIGDKAGTAYTVTIAVRSDATPQFSTSNPPLGISMSTTGYGGEISGSIPLRQNLEGGEYTAFFAYNINNEDNIHASHFSYTNPEEGSTVELLKLLNGEDSGGKKGATSAAEFYSILSPRASITKFGIVYDNVYNTEMSINKIPFMSDVTYSMRALEPNSKFTFETLCNTLFASVAAYDIKTQGLTAAGAHSVYLGEFYSRLNELSTDETSKLDSLLKAADYKGRAIADIFAENYIMAEMHCADTRLKTKDVLLKYSSQFGIDVSVGSDYDNVMDDRLYIIYDGVLAEVSDDTEITDIKVYFDKYVQEALDVPVVITPPSSGSVISGNNLTNPNTTTTKPPVTPAPVITPPEDADTEPEFTDIEKHFSKESVLKLTKDGIISGYPDGSFKPNGSVTRAEFCKIAALAFGIAASEKIQFNDVDANAWYADYVYALASSGIVMGYDGSFMPDSYITREDAAVIIHRIFALKNISISNDEKQFEDTDSTSTYAKAPVGMLANAGVINGDGTFFYPKNSISRGETAVLVCNTQSFMTGGSAK